MNKSLATIVILALTASGAAFAQTTRQPNADTEMNRPTSSEPTMRSESATPPVSGANSFTEGEARNRIEKSGYSDVSGLKKDSEGVWRGTATKDGKPAEVALDFKGNVVPMTQNARAPSSTSPAGGQTPTPTR